MSYRDMGCGEPRAGDAERTLTLSGWVGRRRDHGGLIFIDLRDRSGAVQLVIDPERAPDAHAIAHRLRLEEVVRVRGVLVLRSEETRNPALATGDVELSVSEIELLGPAEVLPFQLDDENVDETLRIHHRYLDLRRPDDAALPEDPRGRHPDHAALPRGSRVLGARDADADALDARGRARLPRAGTALARELLRAAPEPAAVQAALHGRRATTATTRSPAASGTRRSAPTASSSSPSSTSR